MSEALQQIEDLSKSYGNDDFLSAIFGKFRDEAMIGTLRVILFGAGSLGSELCLTLKLLGVDPLCFCDNDSSRAGESYCELPVTSLLELAQKHKESLVVVASHTFREEIKQQLVDHGFGKERILVIPSKCDTYIKYFADLSINRYKAEPKSDISSLIEKSKRALLGSNLRLSHKLAKLALSTNDKLSEPNIIIAIISDLEGRYEAAIDSYRIFIKYNGYNKLIHSRIWQLFNMMKLVKLPSWYNEKREFMNNSFALCIYDIGDFTFCPGNMDDIVYLGTNVDATLTIGKYCSIAKGTTFYLGDGNHSTLSVSAYPIYHMMISDSYEYNTLDSTRGDIVIGNDVWIGTNATILSGVHIGNGAIVGANSIVTRDVPEYTMVAGNPATIKHKRFDDDTIRKLSQIKWWDWDYEKVIFNMPLLNDGKRVSEFIKLYADATP